MLPTSSSLDSFYEKGSVLDACGQLFTHNFYQRHSDFLNGLNTSALPTNPRELDPTQLCPSDRLRLLHEYITSTPDDGGLGVSSDSQQWDRVESVMTIHDPEFNEVWLRSLTKRRVRYEQLDTIRSEVSAYLLTTSSGVFSALYKHGKYERTGACRNIGCKLQSGTMQALVPCRLLNAGCPLGER